MVSNGFSLTVCKCTAVTFLSSSFEWGGGEGRGMTSAKVGLSAKFELTCHFMLCFTEGLFVLHMKYLMRALIACDPEATPLITPDYDSTNFV